MKESGQSSWRSSKIMSKRTTLVEEESKKKTLIRKIKNKFSTEKVMMMLDKEKLEALEEEFAEHPEGLELDNFVWLMKSAMHHRPEEEYDLVHGLCKLFNEVDINGDKHMEWKEFTQYIIDAVMQNQVSLDAKKEEAEEEQRKKKSKQKKMDLLEQAENIKIPRLYQSKVVDKFVHLGYLQKAVYCARYDLILAVENMQKELKFFTPEFKLKWKLEPPFKRKAFLLACSYDNDKGIFGCVASDSCMYFWESQLSQFTPKLIRSLNAPCIQTGLWYLEKHKTWISVGKDNVVREWDIFRGSTADCLLASFEEHEEEVMDVCEIHSPMALATASFDRSIRIYNLIDKTAIGVLKEHKTGVRSLNYTPFHGGNILSVGHENYINVWSPEGSIVRSHVGKLEGHNAPCVAAKFINTTPFCVSVDEKLNIRIWDIRTQQCQQIISYESKSQLPIFGLLIYPGEKKFAVLSKRFLLYDTVSPEEAGQRGQKPEVPVEKKNANKEVVLIDAHFNKYYLSFNVITKNEIRTYDGLTGKLIKVFSEVVDPRTSADLSSFCLDNRHRKCYLGDAHGSIRVFNISNGVFIKHVNNDDDEEVRLKRLAMQNKDKSKEISAMEFVHFDDYLMLVSTGWDSKLSIFDEADPEETQMLRNVKGGHFKDDIGVLAFSEHLSLLATGSRSGIVAVWDFETFKLEGICLGQKRAVTVLSFVKEYPLLVSAGQCGLVTVWGVRPLPLELKYVCLGRFLNLNWDGEFFTNFGVTSGFIRIIQRKAEKDDNEDKEGQYQYIRGKYVPKKEEDSDDEDEGDESDSEDFIEQVYAGSYGTGGWGEQEKVERYVTEFTKIKQDNDPEEKEYWNKDYEKEFKKYQSPFDSDPFAPENATQPKLWFIFSDEKGFIKHWDLSRFIVQERSQLSTFPPRVAPVLQFRQGKLSYNAMRREKLDVKHIAPSYLHLAKISPMPLMLDAKRCVQMREEQAHSGGVHTCREIKAHPFGYITTGQVDQHVKVWSIFGQLWGDIYLLKESYEKNWWFPYKWKELRHKEVEQARGVLDQIRKAQDEKDKAKGREITKQESYEEVVEFEDELEKMMKEQEQKAEFIKQRTVTSRGKRTDYRSTFKAVKAQGQPIKSSSVNTSQIEAVPAFYYASTQNQFLSKDFGQTEEYKRKIKRILEGPPKFYTGFVFDLEQDILALQQRGGFVKGVPKSVLGTKETGQTIQSSKSSLRGAAAMKQGPLTSRTKLYGQEEMTDTLAQSKYFQVTETLRNKYLVESNKAIFSPTSNKDSSKIKSQQTSPQNIKVVDEQEGQQAGFQTERIRPPKIVVSNPNHYLPMTTLRPTVIQSQNTLKPLSLQSKATSHQVSDKRYRGQSSDLSNKISFQSIPSYALKTQKKMLRIKSSDEPSLTQVPTILTATKATNAANAENKTNNNQSPRKAQSLSKQKSEILQTSARKRKIIVGFEVNKNLNGNFLRKLDKLIEVGSRPHSRVKDRILDMKFQPGEGNKLLTKSIMALNNKKYSEVSRLNDALGNELLVSSRSHLQKVAERNKILVNEHILKEQEKRRRELLEEEGMISIFNQK